MPRLHVVPIRASSAGRVSSCGFGGFVLRGLMAARVLPLQVLLSAAASAAPAIDQRGFISDGVAGGLLFQRCDAAGQAAPEVLLLDKTPSASLRAGVREVRQVMLEPGRPLYVEFRGDVAGVTVTARQFQRAIGHVASCAAAPPLLAANVGLFAEGRTPAWRLQSTPAGARLEVAGAKPVQFKTVQLAAAEGGSAARKFNATAAQGMAVRLEVTEQACGDSRSETAYGARIVMHLGERLMEGCAARF